MSLEKKINELNNKQKKLQVEIDELREDIKRLSNEVNKFETPADPEINPFGIITISLINVGIGTWKEWKLKRKVRKSRKLALQKTEIKRVSSDVEKYLKDYTALEGKLRELYTGRKKVLVDNFFGKPSKKELIRDFDDQIKHLKKVKKYVNEAQQKDVNIRRKSEYTQKHLNPAENSNATKSAQAVSLEEKLSQEPIQETRQSVVDMLRGGVRSLKKSVSRGLYVRRQNPKPTQISKISITGLLGRKY